MNWAILLILLIPVGVSILSLLFRNAREDPRRGGVFRPNRPVPGAARPQRRSVSDIDQFLEEINRRRREAAERRKGPEAVAAPAPPPPVARPTPPRVRPSRRLEREVRSTRPKQQFPEPEPVVIAQAVPVAELVAQQIAPPVAPPEPLAAGAIPAVPATIRPRVLSAAVTGALPLLRSAQGLQTAIVLQEVFAKPLSRRGRPGGFTRLPGLR
jgi:hypothetical protein